MQASENGSDVIPCPDSSDKSGGVLDSLKWIDQLSVDTRIKVDRRQEISSAMAVAARGTPSTLDGGGTLNNATHLSRIRRTKAPI